ncbi:sequence-specific DNA binding RNA polymerase II transcription factor [Ascochyta rabiei]|uniref:Sequence-specific DNA binding RNA polymerase II transcription factor n=1 Tax=Didymella rabiei TaxID=5454 RepID=A0A163MKJ3_DIDRA|nr:sequence-specific DNA binding RNA polymerase II transcription factor [Ascochyta rabiei]
MDAGGKRSSVMSKSHHVAIANEEEDRAITSGVSNPSLALAHTPAATSPDLIPAHGMEAETGQGLFRISNSTTTKSIAKEQGYSRRSAHQAHLCRLQQDKSVSAHQPSSPETRLARMFIAVLRTYPEEHHPLLTLGDWISSIPSRIGSCQVVTVAAEFFVHSFEVFRKKSYSNQILALQTKTKALKELRLCILAAQNNPTYDALVATKLHYAAEILLGVESMHYAVHTLGLIDLLKSGMSSGADEEHLWSIIDNTYIDDITIAMTAGRISSYDNDFYLSSTHPAALFSTSLTTSQSTARAMMHILIQCPRLVLLTRQAVLDCRNVVALASAVSLAENLWQLSQANEYADLVSSSISYTDKLVDNTITDIVSHGLRFDCMQNMVFCTRYWLLQIILSGVIDTLHRHFPEAYSLSLLPGPDKLHLVDTDAAMQLGKAFLGLPAIPSLLILVRLQGPLAASIGSWHRVIRYLSSYQLGSQAATLEASQLIRNVAKAERMKQWFAVDERAWLQTLDCMAGEEMPDWMPSKMSFDSEDGDMVLKLEFDGRSEVLSKDIASNDLREWLLKRNPSSL